MLAQHSGHLMFNIRQMSDHRLLTAGIVMAIIGSIVVGGIVYSTIRFRRRREQEGYKTDRRITIVEQGHPASQITPYSSSQNPAGDAPNFCRSLRAITVAYV